MPQQPSGFRQIYGNYVCFIKLPLWFAWGFWCLICVWLINWLINSVISLHELYVSMFVCCWQCKHVDQVCRGSGPDSLGISFKVEQGAEETELNLNTLPLPEQVACKHNLNLNWNFACFLAPLRMFANKNKNILMSFLPNQAQINRFTFLSILLARLPAARCRYMCGTMGLEWFDSLHFWTYFAFVCVSTNLWLEPIFLQFRFENFQFFLLEWLTLGCVEFGKWEKWREQNETHKNRFQMFSFFLYEWSKFNGKKLGTTRGRGGEIEKCRSFLWIQIKVTAEWAKNLLSFVDSCGQGSRDPIKI